MQGNGSPDSRGEEEKKKNLGKVKGILGEKLRPKWTSWERPLGKVLVELKREGGASSWESLGREEDWENNQQKNDQFPRSCSTGPRQRGMRRIEGLKQRDHVREWGVRIKRAKQTRRGGSPPNRTREHTGLKEYGNSECYVKREGRYPLEKAREDITDNKSFLRAGFPPPWLPKRGARSLGTQEKGGAASSPALRKKKKKNETHLDNRSGRESEV